MELLSKVALPQYPFHITHKDKILLTGSCFATNIGERLTQAKFNVITNPFGVVYNPLSIKNGLDRLLSGQLYTPKELFFSNGYYRSFDHHSSFSSPDETECLNRINNALQSGIKQLKECTLLILTFGTSFVYSLKGEKQIVSNCHKLNEDLFDRRRVTPEEIVSSWLPLLYTIKKENPNIHILFTVSPIRHWRDGAHENQLSKSGLLLTIDQLQKELDNIFYFPAYEIMMDELRDYRFYADDLFHPSPLAIDYIWEEFKSSFMDSSTKKIITEWQTIYRALEHKPFNPKSETYRNFLSQTLLKLEAYRKKFPYFEIDKEINFIQSRISESLNP
ncbi:MAG: GSCFA domain-containing protein [Bacteroidales bacterium]|nr:GSCFA domain-containing protein [Bacteroidales bacterium]